MSSASFQSDAWSTLTELGWVFDAPAARVGAALKTLGWRTDDGAPTPESLAAGRARVVPLPVGRGWQKRPPRVVDLALWHRRTTLAALEGLGWTRVDRAAVPRALLHALYVDDGSRFGRGRWRVPAPGALDGVGRRAFGLLQAFVERAGPNERPAAALMVADAMHARGCSDEVVALVVVRYWAAVRRIWDQRLLAEATCDAQGVGVGARRWAPRARRM